MTRHERGEPLPSGEGEPPDADRATLDRAALQAAIRCADADEKALFWSRLSFAASLFTVLAIVFSIAQYFEQRERWRVEHSLAYIRDGWNASLTDASLTLGRLYDRYLETDTADTTFFAFARGRDGDAPHHFGVVVTYWEQIALCVENDICDGDVLRAYIGEGDAPLFLAACPMILDYRRHAASYATRAERFLGVVC